MHSLKTTSAAALAIAAVCGLGIAGPAMAQNQTIRGQGATLPGSLYPSWFLTPGPNASFDYSYNAARAGVPAATGSSAGKNSFTSHRFNTTTSDLDVQYAGSDAILTDADITTYNSIAATYGAPIQLPAVGTPVTIAYNKGSLDITKLTRTGPTGQVAANGTQTSGPVLYLSRRTYCGIFTGGITRWEDSRITADNNSVNIPANALATGDIKVVVRSDGSGTTEIFTRHLDTVCDGSAAAGGFSFQDTRRAVDQSNGAVPPPGRTGGTTVTTSDNFVNWAGFILPSQGSTVPRLITAAGNGGVATAIQANPLAIGYASPDFTDIVAPALLGPGAPNPAPATANLQNQNDITNNVTGAALYSHSARFPNVITAQGGIASPLVTDTAVVWGQKLSLRQGGTTPTATDVRNNPTAAAAYPINGFTFLDFYTCYPLAKQQGVKDFVTYFTTLNGDADVKSRARGFAPLASALKTGARNRGLATTAPLGVGSCPPPTAPPGAGRRTLAAPGAIGGSGLTAGALSSGRRPDELA